MQKVTQFILCAALAFCTLIAVSVQRASATRSTGKYSSTELADYVRYSNASREERGAMLNTLDNQESLWKVHLSLYKDSAPTMTQTQRAVINDTLVAFDTLFTAKRDVKAQLLLVSLKKRSFAAFTKEELNKAFGKLGGIGQASLFACNCYTLSDFCDTGWTCSESQCQNPSEYGCGWLLLEPCNGGCIVSGGGT